MFKNHLKIAFRQLARNKVFSVINILGLSLGMALVILIANFIRSEFSYDNWMEASDRTYRVYRIGNRGETVWTPGRLAEKMANDYPEVERTSGYFPSGERLLSYAGNNFYVEHTANVDSTFFSVVAMNLKQGNPQTVLEGPRSMVISDVLAERIFGDANPIGQLITYDGTDEYMIQGVVDRSSEPTHIDADIFTRFTWYGNSWIGNNRATYARLKPNANPEQLAAKVEKDVNELVRQQYLADGYTPTAKNFYRWKMQPLNDIYLKSEGWMTLGESLGSIRNIYIFGFIALIVMFVAMINYVNLTTARASQRSREVGVKKVVGAKRGLLTTQFITESIMQSTLAAIFALLLAEVSLPFFNEIIGRSMPSLMDEPGWIILGTFVLALLTGLLAGSYPAFIMSSYQPVTALKSSFMKSGGKGMFRKVLVTTQFAVSITLLIVMAFVYRQVNFMMNEDLGFQPDQVMVIPMNVGQTPRRVAAMKTTFKQIPGVEEVTTCSSLPGYFLPDWNMLLEGRDENISPWVLFGDADLGKTIDLEMVQGRFLDHNIGADSVNNFIVNEEFVRQYGLDDPVGHRLKWASDTTYGAIVGVVKDFHFRGLGSKIDPLVMNARPWRNLVGIKLSTADMPGTIAAVEQLWKQVEPTHPMRHTFLDKDFEQQYNEQQSFGKSILYSTLLTLFIALLGLFGLTSFTVERRTREIGIRKVLGASVGNIIGILSRDFLLLVGIAFLIAIPFGYVLSSHWLADFAHRTNMAWWVFLGSGLIMLGVGFATVCLQSIRAALTNPVDSLRSE
ncbi:MAG: ABC transporter permease [Bacteroidota bacterium]